MAKNDDWKRKITAGITKGSVSDTGDGDTNVVARIDIAGWSFERYEDGVVCFTSRTSGREDMSPRPALPMITHTVEGWASKEDWEKVVQEMRGEPKLVCKIGPEGGCTCPICAPTK